MTIYAHEDKNSDAAGVEHALEDSYWAEKEQNTPAYIRPKLSERLAAKPVNQDGSWGPVIQWPHIPVSAANLPDGRILSFASNKKTSFPAGPEFTYAATWDPITNTFVENNHNSHDMFCGHLTTLEDGRIFIAGGRNHVKTTTAFDYRTNTWLKLEDMNRGRWYPTAVTLPNDEVLIAIGSSGGQYPELWKEGQGWKSLTGASLQTPILSYTQYFESSWWPLLHVDPRGKIFHSGPTPKMHTISTDGLGSLTKVGPENHDWYPKHGTTVMYDEGKLLVAGGAISGNNSRSSNKVMTIDITGAEPQITQIAPMTYARKFQNGVMLPTGEVLVIGGNTSGRKFNDSGTILPAEIWNPDTGIWRTIASISEPRNYHSIALLLTDGRVLSAGGGLCGCAADHQDGQVLSPPYLYNSDGSLASRPVITNAPDIIKNGRTFSLQSSTNITKFSLIKMSATTHAVNTDLRYLKVPFAHDGSGNYQLTAHSNINVLNPGFWMLFAVNSNGVPSVAKVIQVSTSGLPSVTQPDNQANTLNASISLTINASDPLGQNLSYSASGLPQGLSININTGVISGQLTKVGIYDPTITVSNVDSSIQILFNWIVYAPGSTPGVSYEYYQGNWSIIPNFNNLTPISTGTFNGFNISPRNRNDYFAFRLSARINITQAGNYTFYTSSDDGSRLWIDGNLVVDNDGLHSIEERSGSVNLNVGQHLIVVGFFERTGGEGLTVKYSSSTISKRVIPSSILFQNPQTNVAPEISQPSDQISSVNANIQLAIIASDTNNDTLSFSATGLPNGLNINTSSGVIGGTTNTIGNFNVTVTVNDGQGESTSVSFNWTVIAPLSISPVVSSPKEVGSTILYNAIVSGGNNLLYKWNFGDGSPTTTYSINSSINHTYTNADTYVVTLFVKDGNNTPLEEQFTQAIYGTNTNLNPSSSSSIIYETTSGNDRVWNVNPDNNTVSVFDAEMNAKIAEISVGNAPRALAQASNGRIWVSNKDSATISIISTSSLEVVNTISLQVGSQPYGVAFSPTGNYAYIVLEATGKILRLNPTTGSVISSLNLGSRPRYVSVDSTGNNVFVTRFVTPKLPDEDTADPKTTLNGKFYGGEVIVINSSNFTITKTIVLKHSERHDSEHSSRGIPNYLGPVVISPDGNSAWIPSKQDNIKRGVLRDGNQLTHDSAVRSISSKIDLNNLSEIVRARVDHDNGGIASNAIFSKNGSYLFVALEGSREVAVLDAYSNNEFHRFPVGRAPQGLVISPDGLTLYTHNYMDRSISVHDISGIINSRGTSTTLVSVYETVSNETLPLNVLNGKQLFYDARDQRLASEQYVSCASCHNDGDTDGRIWDFTGFGEGLRNTIGLIGHGGTSQGPLHWTANFDEIQDFEGQIRGFSGGLGLMSNSVFHSGTHSQPLGDPKAGLSQDLDDLAAYMQSLNIVPSSPYRNQNGSLSTTALQGQQVFLDKNCNSCHSGHHFTDSSPNNLHDIGTIKSTSGQRLNGALSGIDTPTLRGIWITAPYLHDGSADTIASAIQAHNDVSVTSAEILQLVSYLEQLDDNVNVSDSISNEVNRGQITIDGLETDWAGLTAFGNDPDDISGNNHPINFKNVTFAHDDQKLYLRYSNYGNIDPIEQSGSYIPWGWQVFFDADNNSSTGYKLGAIGVDYLLEGNQLMQYSGDGDSWVWNSAGEAVSQYQDSIAEISINRNLLGNPDASNILFIGDNSAYGGSSVDLYPNTLNDSQASSQYFEYSFIKGVNPPQGTPIAHAQSISLQQDNATSVTLLGSDPENDTLTFLLLSNPSQGTLSGNIPNLTYTPDSAYHGSDNFSFAVNDGTETSPAAMVSIHILPLQTGVISNPVVNISVDGNANDWAGITYFKTDPQDMSGAGNVIDWKNVGSAHNTSKLFLIYKNRNQIDTGSGTYIPWGWQAFIDIDNDTSTGFQVSSIGADYIIEGNQLYTHTGDGTEWNLTNPIEIESWYNNDTIELAIPLNDIQKPKDIRFVFIGDNAAYEGTTNDHYPDSLAAKPYLEYTLGNTQQARNRPKVMTQNLAVQQNSALSINLGKGNTNQVNFKYKIITPPSHGILTQDGTNKIYTPSQGYLGTDSIRFVILNNAHQSSIGKIQLTVNKKLQESTGGGSLPLPVLFSLIVLTLLSRGRYIRKK